MGGNKIKIFMHIMSATTIVIVAILLCVVYFHVKILSDEVEHRKFSSSGTFATAERELTEKLNGNLETVKAKRSLLEAKLDIQERMAKVSAAEEINIDDLIGKGQVKTIAPFIVAESWIPEKDFDINGYTLPKPDSLIVEKLIFPGTEIILSLKAKWTHNKRILDDWAKLLGLSSPIFMRGNPDGTLALFFPSNVENVDSVIEMLAENAEGNADNVHIETLTVRNVSLFVKRQNPLAEVISDIRELCRLRDPVKMGNSIFWRGQTTIPPTWIKDVLDSGLTKRYGLLQWGDTFLIDGNCVLWDGIPVSLEMTLYAEDKNKLNIPKEFSKENGFSVSISEEQDGIVKISVTDNFVLNFSALWGV